MPDKRSSSESSSSPEGKRQRTSEGYHPTPGSSSSTASSSSANRAAFNWQELIQSHLVNFYFLRPEMTNEQWKTIYQTRIERIFASLPDQRIRAICHKLFSADVINKIVILEKSQQEPVLQALIDKLKEMKSAHYPYGPRDLAIFLHHRMPENLARALYEKAINQETGLSRLHWALICRRPISEDMAADINLPSATPALYLVVCFNRPLLVSRLKELGADMNIRNQQGMTPCYLSTQYGFYEVTRQLLHFGANPKEANLWASLFIAVHNGHTHVVELLLDAMDLSPLLRITVPAFYRAVCEAAVPTLNRLLQLPEIIDNFSDKLVDTPLLNWAITKGFVGIVESLLKAGVVKVNSRTNNGITLLHLAALKGQPEVIKVLMAHGAADGMAVLKYAVENDKPEIIDALFESGLYISPVNCPKWLRQELTIRSNINTIFGLNLDIQPDCKVMPLGYSLQGEWLISSLLSNKQQTFRPEALGLWFKSAPHDIIHFRLALKLISTRLASNGSEVIELSAEEEQDLCSGNLETLGRSLYSRLGHDRLIPWVNALISAPETVRWCETYRKLAIQLQKIHVEELERRDAAFQLTAFQFFQPESQHPSSSSQPHSIQPHL